MNTPRKKFRGFQLHHILVRRSGRNAMRVRVEMRPLFSPKPCPPRGWSFKRDEVRV